MLKANFKHLKKVDLKKQAYAKPELFPLGRATFLTHGMGCTWGKREKDSNGEELLWLNNTD